MQVNRLTAGLAGACSSALLLGLFATGCGGFGQKDEPDPVLVTPEPVPNPLPRFLRGTVRYEAEMIGYGPSLAQGYGLVVGLNGTGSRDIPVAIRAIMEREASRLIDGSQVTDTEQMNVSELLDSEDTAVVLVEGAIPPGAPAGTVFDIRVSALPATSTTSLEGGRLWTTALRQGVMAPGRPETSIVAEARGDLFINPFALGSEDDSVGAEKRVARVISGAEMTTDMPLMLQLRTASFTRSRAITDAINSSFPTESGQRYPTARPVPGLTDERILITVPPSFRNSTDEFVERLMHTPIQRVQLESYSQALARWVRENPGDAQAVSWCWVGVGERALPFVQELYSFPEMVPRLAALKAGAKLNDSLAISYLEELALDDDSALRLEAVELLGEMASNVRISTTLRELLDDESRDVRIAAYESLRRQRDPLVRRSYLGADAAFSLYTVPSASPMVYVTQQDRPEIAVFGDGIELRRPILISTWEGRLIFAADSHDAPIRVYYREQRNGREHTLEAAHDLVGFIRFLGTRADPTTADPSLALSFDQTVSALHALHSGSGLVDSRGQAAPLVMQTDAITQRLIRASRSVAPIERPDSSMPGEGVIEPFPADEPVTDDVPVEERPDSR